MHKYFFLSAILFITNIADGQWVRKLKLPVRQSFSHLSPVNDSVAWAVSRANQFYITHDGGNNWNINTPDSLPPGIIAADLFAINASTALMATYIGFTGVGPGYVYRTTDTGKHWQQVYTHDGNCEMEIDMANDKAGLMICSFSSFNGSVKAGQEILRTLDGGITWTKNGITDPSKDFILSELEVINNEAWIVDYNFIYYSKNLGKTWEKTPMPVHNTFYSYLQVVNNDYMMVNGNSNIFLFVKRPGEGWTKRGDPSHNGGAVTGLILSDKYCLLSMALDIENMFYSGDSARKFKTTGSWSPDGYLLLEKSRNGNALWGSTYADIWINKNPIPGEKENDQQQISIKQALALEQNTPNPFTNTTSIPYHLPAHFTSAQIIITGINGNLIKTISLNANDHGRLTFAAGTLAPGIYFYSLIIDGKKIDSKQMQVMQ